MKRKMMHFSLKNKKNILFYAIICIKNRDVQIFMVVGTGIKSRNGAKQKVKRDKWTCGCTEIYCATEVQAECIKCGGVFSRGQINRVIGPVLFGGGENVNVNVIEFVADNALAEKAVEVQCERCSGQGWIKAFTQEWDMIKSHHAPCPACNNGEWLEWSAGKRLLVVK